MATFDAVADEARRGDFVYFDPPYDPVSATADFTSYTRNGFGVGDQERLAEVFGRLVERGCAVMLSNSDTPFVRKLFEGYDLCPIIAPRAISSKSVSLSTVHRS